MKIAVEGCAHGELNKIYESIKYIETQENIKIDLLICCGDFQSVRHHDDMVSMAVPVKYREMKDFSDYYNGKRKAPVLTLFIGGNHEAANYLWELPYGGYVAENIFYMGYAGVVNFAGLRIGGLSGIYKQKDYYKGHFETPPFNEDTKRSFYHVRSCDVAKLKLLVDQPFDIFLSHDWPKRIYHHGDKEQLIRFKPFLKDEIFSNTLGSDAAEDLLNVLKPNYWFSGHMHAKFSALIQHANGQNTKFLALDKCLPRRSFLQVLDMGPAQHEPVLTYDKDWISVLQSTNHIFSKSCKQTFLVELPDDHKPNEKKLELLEENCKDFTVSPFVKSIGAENEQTSLFCKKFNLGNPCLSDSPVINNLSGSSRFATPSRRISLPKPVQSKATAVASKSIDVNTDEDEFSDITNPNLSSNPEEIDLSESSESDDDSIKENDISKTEPPSFIETPLKTTVINSPSGNISSSDISICISDEIDSCCDTPIPKKKFKLVRRNQDIYSVTDEKEEDA